jgi:DNA polymerase-3 subunit beta
MKFSVKRDDLFKALNRIQSVVERRNSTISVLANVKIEADQSGFLTLTTTDMDTSATDKIQATVETAGTTTVPVLTMFEIVKRIPQNCDMELKLTDQSNMIILAQSSDFSLPCINAAEFPDFEVSEATTKFSIHSELLKSLFSKTRHAVSNEETRYYLNGIFFHSATSEEGTPSLVAVATDGHRLAKAQTILPEGAQDMPGVIIPKKAVNELVKLLEDYVGEVSVHLSKNRVTFIAGTSTLTSKLIDGKFPDYDKVIPKSNDKTLKITRDQFARAIELVIAVSNDKTRTVRLNIEPDKMMVQATSEMNANARGAQELQVTYDSKEPVSIGFNSRYILDSLAVIDGDTVKISLSNNIGAVLAQDANENNYVYLLMPMQV